MMNGIDSNQTSTWASSLFSKLDTQNKGYLEKTDFQTAFSSISDNTDSADSAEDAFELIDGDSDGKVTENELATAFQSAMPRPDGPHGPGGPHGAPPPPPDGEDAGLTKDELSTMLEGLNSTDDKASSMLSNVLENFDAADSDKDGKVTFKESMDYERSSQGTDSKEASADAVSVTADNRSAEDVLSHQLFSLLKAYNLLENPSNTAGSSSLSVTA